MTAEVVARSRARERNTRAAITSLGLLAFAMLCLYLVFGGVHLASHAATAAGAPRRARHSGQGAALARPVAHTSTTAATTTTTVPESFTVATDPVTTPPMTGTPTIVPIATTAPPPTTATTIATTTTTTPSVTASVQVTDKPNWCTVVVTLSTGEQGTFDLAPYLAAPGDSYLFDATVGKYTVPVTTTVVLRDSNLQCKSTASAPTRA